MRVFDGDFCATRDEALSKYKERFVKDKLQNGVKDFFTNRSRRSKQGDAESGVVNLIMKRIPSSSVNIPLGTEKERPSQIHTRGGEHSGRGS